VTEGPANESRRKAHTAPEPFETLKNDLNRVRADVQKHGLRDQMGRTLALLEAFYLSEDERRRLAAMPWLRRWLYRSWWLLSGLLMKLTPTRRVLLAFALVFMASGMREVRFETIGVEIGVPPLGPLLGNILLLTVLMLELKDKLVARDELEAGRRVQLALMPERSPTVPGWDLWLYTEPANDVGGDLIDHQRIDDRRHAVVLGDVAGKALPAALLMVKLQATLRALAPQFRDLGDLGSAVNTILQRDGLPNRFATLVFLVVTPDRGEISVLNAGHMPPILVRGSEVEALTGGSIALGMIPDAAFSEQRIELRDGDVLVVYSDGVTEAMNESDDFFGDDRLQAAIRETIGQSVEAIGTRILGAVEAFVADAPRHDDVSLMILKRREPEREALAPSGVSVPATKSV